MKSMVEKRGRWDAGFRSPLLRYMSTGSFILMPSEVNRWFPSCMLLAHCLGWRRLGRFTTRPSAQVVYRQTLIDEDSVRIKAWLLRLSEAEQGNFYWDAPWRGHDRSNCRYLHAPACACFVCETKSPRDSSDGIMG